MKQTSNTIKFLLAQYRAILNNVYLKNLSSTFALATIWVACANANANTLSPATDFGAASANQDGVINIIGANDGEGSNNYSYLQLDIDYESASSELVQNLQGTINITGGNTENNYIRAYLTDGRINTNSQAGSRPGAINIMNGAGLALRGGDDLTSLISANLGSISLSGTDSTLQVDDSVVINVDTLTASSGTVINLTNNISVDLDSVIDAETWNLSGTAINLTGNTEISSTTLKGLLTGSTTVQANGVNTILDFYTVNQPATMNLNVMADTQAEIVFSSPGKNQLNLEDSSFDISGELRVISGTVTLSNNEVGADATVNVENDAILRIMTNDGANASLSAPIFNLLGSIALQGDNRNTATIAGELSSSSTGSITTTENTYVNLYTKDDNVANIGFTILGGNAHIALSGSGTDTLKLGGNLTLNGLLSLEQGNLDLTEATLITSSPDGISVGTDQTFATLVVDSTQLVNFLNFANPNENKIVLSSGSTLSLVNKSDAATPVNLCDFAFNNLEDYGENGKINGAEGAIIQGSNLAIILNDSSSSNSSDYSNFKIKADNFTLNNEANQSIVSLNFNSINVAKSLEFSSILEELYLSEDFILNATDGSGSISSTEKVYLFNGANLTVNGGTWTADAILGLGTTSSQSSSTITVDGSSNASALKLGSDAVLSLISGNINVSGAQAVLDLNNGSFVTSDANVSAIVSATNGATINLKSNDLQNLGRMVKFIADNSSINASGDLSLNDNKFVNAYQGVGIGLVDASFNVSGDFTITGSNINSISLNEMTGTVSAESLIFNGATADPAPENLTVKGNNHLALTAHSALNGNAALTFTGLDLTLGQNSTSEGLIGQNFTVGSNASVNVLGTWAAKQDDSLAVTVDGGALNVGKNTGNDDAGTDGNAGNTGIDGSTGSTGNLTANKFTLLAGSATVAQDSTLNANTLTTGTTGTLTVNGTVSIEGVAAQTDANQGFDQQGTINIDGGEFTIGQTAASGLLGTWDQSAADAGTLNYVKDNFGQYSLTNKGILTLSFDSSLSLSSAQLNQIKTELIKNHDSSNGKLDIGAAKLSDLTEVITTDPETGKPIISWDDFQNVDTDGIIDDQLAEATVQGVDDNFSGNIGAVELEDGTPSLHVSGNSTLINADANAGNFISHADGTVAGATISSGDLTLMGSGSVGDITFDGEGSHETSLTLDPARGDSSSVIINVDGVDASTNDPEVNHGILDNTGVNVSQNVTVNFEDSVIVDSLDVEGSAQFDENADNKDATVNHLTTAQDSTFTADDLTVNSTANVQGNLNITQDLTIDSSESVDNQGNTIQGSVTGEVNVGQDLTANNVAFGNKVTVGGDFIANNTTVSDSTEIGGNFIAHAVEVAEGATVNTNNAEFTGNNTIAGTLTTDESGSITVGSGNTTFTGTVETGNLNFDGSNGSAILHILGTSMTVNDVTGSDNSVLIVCSDSDAAQQTKQTQPTQPAQTTQQTQPKEQISHAGSLHIAGTLNQNGLTLVVDPAYTDKAAIVTVEALIGQNANKTDVGIFTGNVLVAQNSALGVGADLNESNFKAKLANYMNGDSFIDPSSAAASENGSYGAVLYLDRPASINSKYGIVLTAGSVADLQKNLSAITNVNSPMYGYDPSKYALTNTIYLGDGTAFALNINNYKEGDTYFKFVDENTAEVSGSTLVADGGEIVLFGNKYQRKYQIFSPEISIKKLDGSNGTIIVNSINGLLTGSLSNENNGAVSLTIDKRNLGKFMDNTSSPVQQTFTAYLNGYNGEYSSQTYIPANAYLGTLNSQGEYEYNNYFLSEIVFGGAGADLEKVARLGVYGGAAQAALSAGASTYEAISGRMNIGINMSKGMGFDMGMSSLAQAKATDTSITYANNGQGAGLWLSPIYKSHDSDRFGAQGVTYGTDLDLYGVTLGSELTIANCLRVGAAFNVGSGNADGQGAGTGVTNDFDYYGFAVYAGISAKNWSLVGDMSYTVVDNEVEANTSIEKVSASMYSRNFSLGLTSQYDFKLNTVTITPHAGVRYTNINMDDYTVKGSQGIAKYDASSANIVSIPVGVTLSKEIVAGNWSINPSCDLTLTANLGNDTIDGTVYWDGVKNLKTNLESKIMDDWTYGAALGIAANANNISLGLGVNYTGSSSADEYDVTAKVRLVF